MNWARQKLDHNTQRIYDDKKQWVGLKNSAGDTIKWKHHDWAGPGTSRYPHINYEIGGESGHLFLADKIANKNMWKDFIPEFGL